MQVHSTEEYLNQLSPKFTDDIKSIIYETRRCFPEIVETFGHCNELRFPTLLNQATGHRIGFEEDQGEFRLYLNQPEVLAYLKDKYPELCLGSGYIAFNQLNFFLSSIITEGIQLSFKRKE